MSNINYLSARYAAPLFWPLLTWPVGHPSQPVRQPASQPVCLFVAPQCICLPHSFSLSVPDWAICLPLTIGLLFLASLRVFIKSHTCSSPGLAWPGAAKNGNGKKKLFTFLLSSVSMRINAVPRIYIYSYDIFYMPTNVTPRQERDGRNWTSRGRCMPKDSSSSASSFRYGPHPWRHTKQIKVDLPLLTSVPVSVPLSQSISLAVLWPPSLFYSLWLLLCSYKCSLGSHWEHKEH